MYKKYIAVTNLTLCENHQKNINLFMPGSDWYASYLVQIKKIASCEPLAIVLREKSLSESLYLKLSKDVLKICEPYNTRVILHNFFNVAKKLNHPYLHLPLHVLQNINNSLLSGTDVFTDNLSYAPLLGTSVHSVEDAIIAQKLGASYLFAGNIYETECKKGLAGRGLSFLHDVCSCVDILVYAIGGITPARIGDVIGAGAKGACMMSWFMNAKNL